MMSEKDPRVRIPLLSRRTVLGGLAAAAVTPLLLREAVAQNIPPMVAAPEPARQIDAIAQAVVASPRPLPRQRHTATALSGTYVLVAGGLSESGAVLSDAVVYGPNGSITQIAPMNTARYAHAAVLLPYGDVLVLGGTAGAGPLADAELYDPSKNTWTPVTPLNLPRYDHAAVHTTGKQILVIGGYSQGVVTDVEVYLFS